MHLFHYEPFDRIPFQRRSNHCSIPGCLWYRRAERILADKCPSGQRDERSKTEIGKPVAEAHVERGCAARHNHGGRGWLATTEGVGLCLHAAIRIDYPRDAAQHWTY